MAKENADAGREEEDLVAVVEGEDDADQTEGAEGDGDEREGRDAADEGDEDPEQRRVLNRDRKKRGKERAREFRKRDEQTISAQSREILELRRRLETVEGVTDAGQRVRVDDAIGQTERAIAAIREKKKKAIADVDAEEVDRLDEDLYKARRHLDDLNAHKRQQTTERRDGGMDPDVQRHARDFFDENKWFDPAGESQDDMVAKAVDKALLRERRLNPSSPDYWSELRKRLKTALPHRFKGGRQADPADDDDGDEEDRAEQRQPERKRPPTMGSGAGGPRPRGVTITKEQKEAMVAAGKWDDPKERKRMLAYYDKYNRDNAPARR